MALVTCSSITNLVATQCTESPKSTITPCHTSAWTSICMCAKWMIPLYSYTCRYQIMCQGMRSTMNRISSSASFAHLSHLHISVSEVQAQINNKSIIWNADQENAEMSWQQLEVSHTMLLQLCARAARRWCPVDKANCQQSEGSWLRFILLPEEETTYRKSSKGELCFARVRQWNYVKGAMSMWKRSYFFGVPLLGYQQGNDCIALRHRWKVKPLKPQDWTAVAHSAIICRIMLLQGVAIT